MTTSSTTSAIDRIRDILAQYGLESLADQYFAKLQAGEPDSSVALWLRSTTEYKARFPGMTLRQANGLPAISESEYISYESTAQQLFREAGLPQGFYDTPDDFAKWIGGNVSIKELAERVDNGYLAAAQADPATKAELQRLYNVSDGQLAAYFLDPDRALPVIQKQFLAAQESGAAVRTGFGALTQMQAEAIASLGVSPDQAQQTFEQLATMGEIVTALPGERQDTAISTDTEIAAGFQGDAKAAQDLSAKIDQRKAQFAGGGSVLTSEQQGLIGLQTANTG